MKTIAIIESCDTKYREAQYIKELVEKEGGWYLDTNIYDLLKDFTVQMIDTDVLGKAFEPAQKFENTDGSPIRFDLDYFGQHRGSAIIPGPFADAADAKKQL